MNRSETHGRVTVSPVRVLQCVAVLVVLCFGAAFAASEKHASFTRETLGLSYPEGRTISVKFLGTSRLPRSSGEAKVERKKGMTEIEIELDDMKPASLFGGDFNTYVLWVASPEGHVDNTGEFTLEGNRSKLNVSTTSRDVRDVRHRRARTLRHRLRAWFESEKSRFAFAVVRGTRSL